MMARTQYVFFLLQPSSFVGKRKTDPFRLPIQILFLSKKTFRLSEQQALQLGSLLISFLLRCCPGRILMLCADAWIIRGRGGLWPQHNEETRGQRERDPFSELLGGIPRCPTHNKHAHTHPFRQAAYLDTGGLAHSQAFVDPFPCWEGVTPQGHVSY